MRFLLDESISRLVVPALREAGHDVAEVTSIGLTSAADPVVLQAALDDARVLVTLDTDFGALLAHSGDELPSVVLLRGEVTRLPARQAALLLANLDQVESDLEAGALVVIADGRVRVRRLPIRGGPESGGADDG